MSLNRRDTQAGMPESRTPSGLTVAGTSVKPKTLDPAGIKLTGRPKGGYTLNGGSPAQITRQERKQRS